MALEALRTSGRRSFAFTAMAVLALTSPTRADDRPQATRDIDRHITARWRGGQDTGPYTPADRCNDYEFIRRATLDIIGRIATVEEIERYLKDPLEKRRAQLVERLLASPEYAPYWATRWSHWLITRSAHPLHQEQLRLWLEEAVFARDRSYKEMVEGLLSATGKTNANGAVHFILAHVGAPTADLYPGMPEKDRLDKYGQFDVTVATARTARLFHGAQIQCCACHDHPFNADWRQKHFWQLNTFFRQVERVGVPGERDWIAALGCGPLGSRPLDPLVSLDPVLTLKDNPAYNGKGVIFFEKRNGVLFGANPVFLDGQRLPANFKGNRRAELARLLTGQPQFARTYVNRMWSVFFNRGLCENPACDDFGDHNLVVQEDMLSDLARHFEKGGHRPKDMIRWICLSMPYQLKAVANATNDKDEDAVYFSRQLPRTLSPEQLSASILTAANLLQQPAREWAEFRAAWNRKLATHYPGDQEGNEGYFQSDHKPLLWLMNGADMRTVVSWKGSPAAAAAELPVPEAIDRLFLATLNRPATPREHKQIKAQFALPGGDKEADLGPALQDLFWALLCCNEFAVNR